MKNATIIAMTFATLLTTGMMSANAEAATCKSFTTYASGSSAGAIAKFRKRRAERRAKASWEAGMTKKYGSQYANINAAKNVKVSCGLNARGNTKCTVSAKACVSDNAETLRLLGIKLF